MIFDNGYLEVEKVTGGGLVDGIPQEAILEWENPIPCHIVKNENQQGKAENSTFTKASFVVWLDSFLYKFDAKRVRLTHKNGVVLGMFEVQSVEFSDLVGRTKIVC